MSKRLSPVLVAVSLFVVFGGSQAKADPAASNQPVHAAAASRLQGPPLNVNHLPSRVARLLRKSPHLRHDSTLGRQRRFNAVIPSPRSVHHSCCTYLGFYLWAYPWYVALDEGDFFYGPFDLTYYVLDFYEAGYGYAGLYYYYIPANRTFYGPYYS